MEWDEDRTIWEQLYATLRARITSGQYRERSVIPSLTQLEQEFGVARTTIQKVLRLLKDEFLIRTIPGKGTYVRPQSEWRHNAHNAEE
ncbi:winged helix-turn-helix domain-containing protein [Streptosporangium sp. NPDC006013]|uniref:winged helix-turn-helix domain-containing protein n=1 Tax=Streptosporangium sp. NPDC006013 TaxID=3155596 RepID=UPI0033BF7041